MQVKQNICGLIWDPKSWLHIRITWGAFKSADTKSHSESIKSACWEAGWIIGVFLKCPRWFQSAVKVESYEVWWPLVCDLWFLRACFSRSCGFPTLPGLFLMLLGRGARCPGQGLHRKASSALPFGFSWGLQLFHEMWVFMVMAGAVPEKLTCCLNGSKGSFCGARCLI